MERRIVLILFGLLFFVTGFSQVDSAKVDTSSRVRIDLATANYLKPHGDVYKLKKPIDIPFTVLGTAWSLYAFTKIYNKDSSTVAQINALKETDVISFNRPGIKHYSPKAFDASNIFFYGSMPLPLLFLFDKDVRKDAGKIGLLYMEAMAITGVLYSGSAYVHDKYRPLAYNPDVPMWKRTRGGAKNSFFAGHVALVGTSTFFMASVYDDYHPHQTITKFFYGAAAAATLATGYLRYRAGEHFRTDIMIGVAVGTLSGILVPHWHKNKLINNPNLSVKPFVGPSNGLMLVYKL